MPKFAARTIKDLMTPARDAGRLARRVPFVVCCEADDGSWFELDATSEEHGRTLADNMIRPEHACRGCSLWRVRDGSGKLAKRSSYNVYA